MIFLLRLNVHDGSSASTIYLATDGYTSTPTDNPANQYFADRAALAGSIERHMFSTGDGLSGGTTGGASQVGFGAVNIVNGAPYGGAEFIDDWIDLAFRTIRIESLPNAETPLSQAKIRFIGTIEQLVSTKALAEFDLNIHDRLSDLDRPLLTHVYGGTTTGGGQGTIDGAPDQADQIKSKVWGTVHNVAAIDVNPFDLIRQVNDGPVQSIIAYDGGAVLTYDGDFGTLPLLFAASVGSGHYVTCNAEGVFRLGASAIGTVTADVIEGATAADRTAAGIVARMIEWLQDMYPSLAVELSPSSIAALDAINAAQCGIVVEATETALSAMMRVLNSVGAWLLPQNDSDSMFDVGRFDVPTGAAVASYDIDDNLDGEIERIESGDEGKGIPVHKVIVQYDQLPVVMTGSEVFPVVADTDPARVAYLATEFRQAIAQNTALLTQWPNAPTITIETRLLNQADAAAEAARLLGLYSVRRDIYRMVLPMSPDPVDDPDLGDVVELVSAAGRMGLGTEAGSGKKFVVTGRIDDFDAFPQITLILWG